MVPQVLHKLLKGWLWIARLLSFMCLQVKGVAFLEHHEGVHASTPRQAELQQSDAQRQQPGLVSYDEHPPTQSRAAHVWDDR